jgi:hypothetical protein
VTAFCLSASSPFAWLGLVELSLRLNLALLQRYVHGLFAPDFGSLRFFGLNFYFVWTSSFSSLQSHIDDDDLQRIMKLLAASPDGALSCAQAPEAVYAYKYGFAG